MEEKKTSLLYITNSKALKQRPFKSLMATFNQEAMHLDPQDLPNSLPELENNALLILGHSIELTHEISAKIHENTKKILLRNLSTKLKDYKEWLNNKSLSLLYLSAEENILNSATFNMGLSALIQNKKSFEFNEVVGWGNYQKTWSNKNRALSIDLNEAILEFYEELKIPANLIKSCQDWLIDSGTQNLKIKSLNLFGDGNYIGGSIEFMEHFLNSSPNINSILEIPLIGIQLGVSYKLEWIQAIQKNLPTSILFFRPNL